uniref:Uncharacterized protein n=1 Tax=Arion vulgaris TaxID=1028688 RepID=A0A0B7AYM8_9EUPU
MARVTDNKESKSSRKNQDGSVVLGDLTTSDFLAGEREVEAECYCDNEDGTMPLLVTRRVIPKEIIHKY